MPNDMESSDSLSSETIRLLQNRVSVRKYTDRPVSGDHVHGVLEAAYRAPTSSNIQAYSVVIVRDQGTKDGLCAATGNQRHVAAAPVFLAFCADLTRIEAALKKHGHSLDDSNMETCLVSSIDASLVGMAAYVAADSIGLKGVMIGGVRNKPREVTRLLGLPHRVYCVFGMCLGWPEIVPGQKPRMAYDAVTHHERYDASGQNEHLERYDEGLAAHYQAAGRSTTADSWTHDMDAKFFPPLRDDLRKNLAEMGFDFG